MSGVSESMRNLGRAAADTQAALRALAALIPEEPKKGPVLKKPSEKKRRRTEVRNSRRRNR